MAPRLRLVQRIAALALACAAAGAIARESTLTFVACPVYRDTNAGRKSGCWLANEESTGIRYDITQGRTKPQLGREVLVEGRRESGIGLEGVSPKETPCGGIPLAPVVVSVLDSQCPSFMLPAEGFAGRRFVLDPKVVLAPADVPEQAPPPPYRPRSWSIEFTFGSDFLQYQYSEIILDEIGRYIRASHPREVEITGYAVTERRVVSEHVLAEKSELARSRAERVALALRRLGATDSMLRVSWRENPAPIAQANELPEPSRRRVDIHLSY